MTSRTLNEMTDAERAQMISLVAQALESVAEDADERGDEQSARNAIYLACSIRGCGIGASIETIKAAEILLEHGISYVASLSERYEQPEDGSNAVDVDGVASEQHGDFQPSRTLH